MGYPLELLLNPPAPTYPEYPAIVARARKLAPRFVDPANLHPQRPVVEARGADWCTAVLGRPFGEFGSRITVHEQYLLIAADEAGIDPQLPDWIVEARAESAAWAAERDRQRAAYEQRQQQTWAAALAGTDVTFEVREGSRARARGMSYEPNRHAVPLADAYSGSRKTRTHPAGRAVCESPDRARPLELQGVVEAPATCVQCLKRVPQLRSRR